MARAKNRQPYQVVFREDPLGWDSVRNRGYGFGDVGAIHKLRMEDGRPYRFANELICGRIAQFLLLPVPPFGFTYFAGQKGVPLPQGIMFSEIDFNCERESPPLPDLDACVDSMPRFCAGILAFDILVANPDRRRDHLWCDDPQHPTRLLMFDHDLALCGSISIGQFFACNYCWKATASAASSGLPTSTGTRSLTSWKP